MIQTENEPLDKTKHARVIGHITGAKEGPTFIFFGGIHGNEPAGVKALEHVFPELQNRAYELHGAVYGLRGNIPGILSSRRYVCDDLNRLWTASKIEHIRSKPETNRSPEEKQLIEILDLVLEIIHTRPGPIYFVDIHTTSSKSIPFITINDALINRKFSTCFPIPVVLGIEEYLKGPLLSYINELGYVSLGFEAGQHQDEKSTENAIAFTWLALVFAGILPVSEIPEIKIHHQILASAAGTNHFFYEVTDRFYLEAADHFKMAAGFQSFDAVRKGTLLGRHNSREVVAPKNAVLFMPLYQDLGEDGFFLIKKIPNWALKASAFLRKINWDLFLVLLPGISWADGTKKNLKINTRIVRFMRKPVFHLLGYRRSSSGHRQTIMSNRERRAKKALYKTTWWYKK